MECKTSDSKKLFKVFDASKRKRTRKKRVGQDENSPATDDSTSVVQTNNCGGVPSRKQSMQEMPNVQGDMTPEAHCNKRERDSSPSVSQSPVAEIRRSSRSPRCYRRQQREGISLALKAGLISTPRSISPPQEGDVGTEPATHDQDSFIYTYLEEAIKRDKKRQRHARRHEERRASRDRPERRASLERDASEPREHRYHHRRRRDEPSRELKPTKNQSPSPEINQTVLLQTFAKLCAQMNEKTAPRTKIDEVLRTQSHKSLQCEVLSRRDAYDVAQRPVKLRLREHSPDNIPSSRVRSHETFQDSKSRFHCPENTHNELEDRKGKCVCHPQYSKVTPKYNSKLDVAESRILNVAEERFRDYSPRPDPTRSYLDHSYRTRAPSDRKEYRDFDEPRYPVRGFFFDDDRRRYIEQKTSRSFEVHRECYPDDERACRRTARSDPHKKSFDEQKDGRDQRNRVRRFDERKELLKKYCEDKTLDPRERHFANLLSKNRRSKKNLEHFERNSTASRDDDYRDRDGYSERERDSGLSVVDGETSTVSGRSNYLRVVKQEIAEQREAMDKMMKLWKELMRCFKGISQTQGQDKVVHESAAENVQESAAAQLRLWRECMRRYETVARDVGDTDARLMEEITKQRSEMAEMSSMWQECLQRYREMSSDFNNLKQQQLATSASPTRAPAPVLVCAEGEGTVPPAPYRLPPHYPPLPNMDGGYGGGVGTAGSPLRSRASAPPAWWWCGEPPQRRRSSPESRGSRSRDRRHRHKDREDKRNKEKSSKPSAARSEHRHRKR